MSDPKHFFLFMILVTIFATIICCDQIILVKMISYKLFKRIFCFVSYLNKSINLVSHNSWYIIKIMKNLIRNSIIYLLQSTLIYLYNNDIKKIIGIIRRLE